MKKPKGNKPSRDIDSVERLKLWVKSGGRCAFPGCTQYLLKGGYTEYEWPIGDMAHIVGHSKKGPRGTAKLPLRKRNLEKNLILLCPTHHREVDRLAKKYGIGKVVEFKRTHEKEIHSLTALSIAGKTTVLRMQGLTRGEKGVIADNHIREAVIKHSAKIPGNNYVDISLPTFEDKQQYWQAGRLTIDQAIGALSAKGFGEEEVSHISVFALARIPLLVYLGSRLSDKVQTDIYQKHRNGPESWCWSKSKKTLDFCAKTHRGKSSAGVALVLSLSGQIDVSNLPQKVQQKYAIYEICPKNEKPNRDLISTPAALDAFRQTFQKLLRKIESRHPKIKTVSLFPAISVSVAVTCGRELLKDLSPSLSVHDYINNEYRPVLEVSK